MNRVLLLQRFAFAASVLLAFALIFSCSDGNAGDNSQDVRGDLSSGDSSSSVRGSSNSLALRKCDDIFNPNTDFCYDGVIYSRCNGMEYNPTTHICTGTIATRAKCGGADYNPLTQSCCNNVYTFDLSTQGCCNNVNIFDLSTQRCGANAIETKCGNGWYNERSQGCCNNVNIFDLSTQRCGANAIETKCGYDWLNGTSWYNERSQGCCTNGNIFDLSTQRCEVGTVETKCGSSWYNETSQGCCNNVKIFNLSTQGCCNNGNIFDLSTQRCGANAIETKCENGWYNEENQRCYENGEIVDRCGINPQPYDPSLYECKPTINPNGIFLKTPEFYEGESYEAVLIGTQVWMAKNLNYDAEGSLCLVDEKTGTQCGTCFVETTGLHCISYGRLYDRVTALTVCPEGWHLPSNAEWEALITAVGGKEMPARKLKATRGWNNNSGTDAYGFSGYASGIKNPNDRVTEVGIYGYWWTSTEFENYRFMNIYGESVGAAAYYYPNFDDTVSLSVRCVKDELK